MSTKSTKSGTQKTKSSVYDTKVYIALTHLSVYELNRFRKFLESPYFNKNQSITDLFDCLEPGLRSENGDAILRGQAWHHCFGNKPYDDLRFRKLCSDLLKLLERFLAQEVFEENPLHLGDYLLQAVNKKKLEVLYNSAIRTANRLSDQQYLRPATFYYYQYSFERGIYSLTGSEIERGKVINVESIARNLDIFYLAEKLRYYCYVLARKPFIAHEYDLLFMDDIVRHIEQEEYDDIIPIRFYYQIYLTLSEPEVLGHYDQLKTLINKYILQLPDLEAKEIIDSALNYCIKKANDGNQDYVRELFEMYVEALEKELIYVNGFITPWTFKNVIVSGLRLGEYAWVEEFIERYQFKIHEKYRDNAVSINLATLYFYSGEYNKVIEQLQSVEYDDISYNLNGKTILMATYYELDELDPLMSLLSAFSAYLRRNKSIPAERRQHYQNLLRFTRKLVHIPVSDKEALARLRKAVDTTEGVVNKHWLLEKIDELL